MWVKKEIVNMHLISTNMWDLAKFWADNGRWALILSVVSLASGAQQSALSDITNALLNSSYCLLTTHQWKVWLICEQKFSGGIAVAMSAWAFCFPAERRKSRLEIPYLFELTQILIPTRQELPWDYNIDSPMLASFKVLSGRSSML